MYVDPLNKGKPTPFSKWLFCLWNCKVSKWWYSVNPTKHDHLIWMRGRVALHLSFWTISDYWYHNESQWGFYSARVILFEFYIRICRNEYDASAKLPLIWLTGSALWCKITYKDMSVCIVLCLVASTFLYFLCM